LKPAVPSSPALLLRVLYQPTCAVDFQWKPCSITSLVPATASPGSRVVARTAPNVFMFRMSFPCVNSPEKTGSRY
jgi:hypothetical protein